MKKLNNGLYEWTKEDIEIAIFKELDRLDNEKGETAKAIRKMENCLKLLENVPSTTIFEMEEVAKSRTQRNFILFNAGSFAECIIKLFYPKQMPKRVGKSMDLADMQNGAIKWEIKSGLTDNGYPTPSQAEPTILINLMGIFELKKGEVLANTDKNHRLPTKKVVGKRMEWLEKKIGWGVC